MNRCFRIGHDEDVEVILGVGDIFDAINARDDGDIARLSECGSGS
jgi:hypothetical protein